MLDILPLGLALLDDGGTCVQTNAIFRETAGCDCTGPEGVLALAVPEDRAHFGLTIALTLGGDRAGREIRLRLDARPEETVVLTLAKPPAGWGFALLLAVRDIREQVRLERQVAQATKMQAVGQLAGGIAHDFNNILTAVLGLTDQLLDRHPPGTSDHDDLAQIRLNGDRAANLVRQLLAFARQQTLRPQVLDIAAVIDGLVPLLRQLIGPEVVLDVIHGRDIGALRVDPGQLEQVLVNLAVNARDAMSGKGRLVIETRAIPADDVAALGHDIMPTIDHIGIIVTDTGVGIPPEIAAKIFEPFFTTKPTGQGTGLGLSTVYGIVKQTGGFIFASAPAGGGTSFAVYLPTAPPLAALPPPPPSRRPATLDARVLLVEDDRAVRRVLERALGRHGLQVTAVADAGDALALIGSGGSAIDVLVSDVVMPGMDGVTLFNRVREALPGLPVVLMSGYAEPPQRRALDRAGVVFLAKPFAIDDLLDAVHTAIAAGVLDTGRDALDGNS